MLSAALAAQAHRDRSSARILAVPTTGSLKEDLLALLQCMAAHQVLRFYGRPSPLPRTFATGGLTVEPCGYERCSDGLAFSTDTRAIVYYTTESGGRTRVAELHVTLLGVRGGHVEISRSSIKQQPGAAAPGSLSATVTLAYKVAIGEYGLQAVPFPAW